MTQEHFIMAAVSAITVASVFYIPKDKYRLALISFVSSQAITWAGSLIQVQLGAYEYPVREFPVATRGSFLHLFLFAPMIFTWFILVFPSGASLFRKILHYFIFVSVVVWFIIYISYYTDLQNQLKGTALTQIIGYYFRFTIYFVLCKLYISWFAKKVNLPAGGQGSNA